MGCDIHFVVETKYNGRWVGIFQTGGMYAWKGDYGFRNKVSPFWQFSDRDYRFFGRLAGVRSPGPDALGAPNDCSDLAQMDIAQWDGDGHSHSYCSLRQFVVAKYGQEELIASAMRNKIQGGDDPVTEKLWLKQPDDEERSVVDNSRVVFWFDN